LETVPTHPELTKLSFGDHLAKFDPSRMAACSAVRGAASCPPSPTGAPGRKRAALFERALAVAETISHDQERGEVLTRIHAMTRISMLDELSRW
jgi:hypothetical protein